MSHQITTVPNMADPQTVEQLRAAATGIDDHAFLELLRWHRAVAGLPDLDWTLPRSYRQGVSELAETRAQELLHDVRRAIRDPRRHRHGADGKPVFRDGRSLKDQLQYRQ